MIKTALLLIAAGIYVTGFGLMFTLQAQSPVTFGLALIRSAAWPVAVVLRHEWPRGQRQPIGDEDLM